MNENNPQTCIVLRATDYKEADKILTLFSRENGKITAQARGVRRMKSTLKSAAQPFCCAEYEFYIRNDKYYIRNASIKSDFFNIQSDYQRYAAGCLMLNATGQILDDSGIWSKLFSRLVNTLYALDTGLISPKAAIAYYFIHIIELMGIFPSLNGCAVCGKNLEMAAHWCALEGGLLCQDCAADVPHKKVHPNIPGYFKVLKRINAKDAEKVINECEKNKLLNIIEEYLNINGDMQVDIFRFLKR